MCNALPALCRPVSDGLRVASGFNDNMSTMQKQCLADCVCTPVMPLSCDSALYLDAPHAGVYALAALDAARAKQSSKVAETQQAMKEAADAELKQVGRWAREGDENIQEVRQSRWGSVY